MNAIAFERLQEIRYPLELNRETPAVNVPEPKIDVSSFFLFHCSLQYI